MLKNYRLIALVFVFAASGFGVFAQTNETLEYKDVLLDGKPAKLNLVTGEITFTNGEIAKSREARKIKDSVLENRTEIKTNLLTDILESSEITQNGVVNDSIDIVVAKFQDSIVTSETSKSELTTSPEEDNYYGSTTDIVTKNLLSSNSNNVETNPNNFHMVKKGETLYALSQRYGTSLGQLKTANNLDTTLIKEGQTLRVRNFEIVESDSDVVWVVSKGDTLYNIAKRNNTTVNDIKDLNNLSSNLIKIGQKLQVNQNSTLSKK